MRYTNLGKALGATQVSSLSSGVPLSASKKLDNGGWLMRLSAQISDSSSVTRANHQIVVDSEK
jgi:hypothetical protein